MRRVARRERRKAMKLGVEYGEDAAAHDRGALEGGGGAKHEGDENTLHGCFGGVRDLTFDGAFVVAEGDVELHVAYL